jgi:predicted permease
MEEHRAWRLVVEEQFFSTLRIPLLRGRGFTAADTEKGLQVGIINEALARQLFGTTDALGRRFIMSLAPDSPEIEVIGIAAPARYTSVRSNVPPTVYLPARQEPVSAPTFAIRAAADPLAIADSVRETMRQLDPTLPIMAMRTQQEQIATSLNRERLFARLATLLGGVTLALAAIGLYGLLAYAVTRRVPEIGVRMALGAERATVRWMILRQSVRLVVIGLAIGIPLALMSGRYVESLLFGLESSDPLAITAAALVMTVISMIAAFVPAQRASRVDPMIALRAE